MSADRFGTAALRDAVLAAWERSPARFREDANAEEDHGRGYYRDRVVVELAQNAADAAARLGEPGRLLLRLTDDGQGGAVLLAANTGAPLDAAGVASLASLRASAKRRPAAPSGPHHVPATGLVGRFGVGFAAVRAVSDDITVLTEDGGVRFSLATTRAALAGPVRRSPGLRAEVDARGGSLPVLRLPEAVEQASGSAGAVPPGWTTAVVLRLRDPGAQAAVLAQLDAVDDALLLALPALAEVHVETPAGSRTVSDVGSRWISVTRSGPVPADLLADRPVEERSAASWSVTWAVPRDAGTTGTGDPAGRGAVHAPTPTDEPLTVPALLVASFPLDPSRRHVAQGGLAGLVAHEAGSALAELAVLVPRPLDLVPTGLPAGRVDADVRDAALEALRSAPVLGGRVAADTVVVDVDVSPDLEDALAATGLGVVRVGRQDRAAARLLGARTMSLPDVVDALPAGMSAPPWRRLYDALAPYADADRTVLEALTGVLVPLADGTTTRGPRGLVLGRPGSADGSDGSDGSEPGSGPAVLGLRVVHPDATHPLLLRLGALAADDARVLTLPGVESAARAAADDLIDADVDEDAGWPADVAALLALVGAVAAAGEGRAPQMPSWLGDVPLPADDGTWQPADELAWPGSWAAEHLDLARVDVPTRAGDGSSWTPVPRAVATLLGVRERLVVRVVGEHLTGQGTDLADGGLVGRGDGSAADGVPGWDEYDEYLTAVLGPDRPVGDVLVVADLDVVHADAWDAVVDALAQEPQARAALLDRVRPLDAGPSGPARDGSVVPRASARPERSAASYTAWYLRDVLRAPFLAPGGAGRSAGPASGLAAILPDAPAELAAVTDERVLEALGAITGVDGLETFLSVADPAGWDAFATGLPVSGTPVATPVAHAVWAGLAQAAAAGLELDPLPERLVALQGAVARVVEADDVLVAGEPMWAQVHAVVPVADPAALEAVADALDATIADASAASVRASDDPEERSVPEALALVVGAATGAELPATWRVHDELAVDGRAVEWWVTADGAVHVAASSAPEAAAARGLAQAAGRWESRHTIEVVLRDAARAADAATENAWTPPVRLRG